MTPDPGNVGANVGDPQSWNAYVYAGNDPINGVDPLGLYVQRVFDTSVCELGRGTLIAEYIGTFRSMDSSGVVTFDTATTGYDCDFPDDIQAQGAQGLPQISNAVEARFSVYQQLRYLQEGLMRNSANSQMCAAFLSGAAGFNVSDLIGALINARTVGEGIIGFGGNVPSPNIGAATGGPTRFAYVLNTGGGYFARRQGVNPPGGYGNLVQGQLYIHLHEIGHLTNVIRPDTGLRDARGNLSPALDAAAQTANDTLINQNCRGFIQGRP